MLLGWFGRAVDKYVYVIVQPLAVVVVDLTVARANERLPKFPRLMRNSVDREMVMKRSMPLNATMVPDAM